VAILLTTGLAIALVLTGDLTALADTTVLLLLLVFTVVNISVIVLRKDRVEHDHFRAPTILPVLGAVASLVLASPLTGRESGVYLRALILLALGVVLWALNHFTHGTGSAPTRRPPRTARTDGSAAHRRAGHGGDRLGQRRSRAVAPAGRLGKIHRYATRCCGAQRGDAGVREQQGVLAA
jgi:hypothetical protein